MKKITTRKEKEKKESINKTIFGVFMVAIMVIGIGGYAFLSNPIENRVNKKITYQGIEFVLQENNMWAFEIQGYSFLTQYNPQQTENISTNFPITITNYAGKPLYFAGQDGIGKQEIAINLQELIPRLPQDACVQGMEDIKCEDDDPIKNCSQDNIIIFKEKNFTEITQKQNCVIINSPYYQQARVSDAFLYKIMGIKKF
jgi:hypothetical protein